MLLLSYDEICFYYGILWGFFNLKSVLIERVLVMLFYLYKVCSSWCSIHFMTDIQMLRQDSLSSIRWIVGLSISHTVNIILITSIYVMCRYNDILRSININVHIYNLHHRLKLMFLSNYAILCTFITAIYLIGYELS